MDVANAVSPTAKKEIVGIRPGEKLHEEMITSTDALNTVEFPDYYVILPKGPTNWGIPQFLKEANSTPGKMVEEGFCYNSGTNYKFLTMEELRHLIESELI